MLCLLAPAAGAYSSPRFQPVSIAFFDSQHGLVAEDDWSCQKAHGCEGRILATSDGGSRWQVTYVGARGHAPLPGERDAHRVRRSQATRCSRAATAGCTGATLPWRASIVSFVTAAHGWRLGPATTMAHPPTLAETNDGGRSWATRVNPCRGDFGLTSALAFASATRGWIVCSTQASAGYQGKAVWETTDGGTHWQLEGRTHPIGPPEAKLQVGNLPGFGYPTGAVFLPDGDGWLLQDRGQMLITNDGGHTWRASPLTKPDTIAGQSADLLNGKLAFLLLRGCKVRLLRTTNRGTSWTTLHRWNAPTRC